MKTKILVVDDENDLFVLFRQRFRRQIRDNAYEFFFARDGLEALALLEQHPDTHVVLSDIHMPGMDGLSLLTKLTESYPLTRTVMVTAYGDMNNIRTAMNRGAFDFITKPIHFDDLEVTLQKTIQAVHQLRETSELKALDEMKTRFFVNITHEFRTPLSLIVSPVDKLLEATDLPAPYQQSLLTVRRHAWQLLRLINQLLDINKLEARQMAVVNQIGDLSSFVGQIVELFRPSAAIKQLTLSYQTELSSGNYVFDAGKWEKILYNLLANAIKFTHTGSITVNLTETPTAVQLTVCDTGIGIPASQLPHIFNRFYQVDHSLVRASEGTGIGLALVYELIARLGGDIRVESQPEGGDYPAGTRFDVAIPVERTTPSPETPSVTGPVMTVDVPPTLDGTVPVEDSELNRETPLVLVVEDNAELRDFIVAELATAYRVRSAVDGYEGWALTREELPDVVISDLMMPRMDGYALLRQIKTDPATDHIAVVLLTANVEEDSRLKGFDSGADEYLTKPFHMGELRLRLRNLITRQNKLRQQYQKQLTQPGGPAEPSVAPDPFMRRLYELIDQRLDDSMLSVEWLAEQLAMSRKTLYLKVQSLTQLSPNELIRQYRLRKAIELLQTGHNASETAYLVGFESPSYFTKVFREFYQQTPTDYRKK